MGYSRSGIGDHFYRGQSESIPEPLNCRSPNRPIAGKYLERTPVKARDTYIDLQHVSCWDGKSPGVAKLVPENEAGEAMPRFTKGFTDPSIRQMPLRYPNRKQVLTRACHREVRGSFGLV